jgi:NAD-dependent deacetylase
MPEVLTRLDLGEDDLPCLTCGGIQKSATISFGRALKPEAFAAGGRAARGCDLFLAVGSSLGVQPAAGPCLEAVEHGARLVIINAQETPYDRLADAIVREPIGQVLPTLVSEAC